MKVSIIVPVTLVALASTVTAQPPGRGAPDERAAPPRLVTTGAVLLLATWGLSFGIASQSLDVDNRGLYVPVAGPWIALAERSSCPAPGACHSTSSQAVIALDGVLQVGAAVMVVGGLYRWARDRDRAPRRTAGIAITPGGVGPSAPGVTVAGWF